MDRQCARILARSLTSRILAQMRPAGLLLSGAAALRVPFFRSNCSSLLINFGEDLIKDGTARVVNGFEDRLREAAKEIVPSELCHLSPSTIPRLNVTTYRSAD